MLVGCWVAGRDNGLGLGARRCAGADKVTCVGSGLDTLLARPKISFAADAIVQLPPPPLEPKTPPPLPCRMPELERTLGPLIPPAVPVLLDTSDAILSTGTRKRGLNHKPIPVTK